MIHKCKNCGIEKKKEKNNPFKYGYCQRTTECRSLVNKIMFKKWYAENKNKKSYLKKHRESSRNSYKKVDRTNNDVCKNCGKKSNKQGYKLGYCQRTRRCSNLKGKARRGTLNFNFPKCKGCSRKCQNIKGYKFGYCNKTKKCRAKLYQIKSNKT